VIRETEDGTLCQAWTAQHPHFHTTTPARYPNDFLEQNYCRQPGNDFDVEWCYTTNINIKSATCDVYKNDQCDRSNHVIFTMVRLLFDSENWNIPQTIKIEAIEDDTNDGDFALYSIMMNISSEDAVYGNYGDILYEEIAVPSAMTMYYDVVNPPIIINVTDNDNTGVVFSKTQFSIREGRNDSISLVLSTRPEYDVYVNFSNLIQINELKKYLTLSEQRLAFNDFDWSIPKTITLSAIDDLIVEDNITVVLTTSVESRDESYTSEALKLPDVHVTLIDDDTEGVIVTPLFVNITEGGPYCKDTFDSCESYAGQCGEISCCEYYFCDTCYYAGFCDSTCQMCQDVEFSVVLQSEPVSDVVLQLNTTFATILAEYSSLNRTSNISFDPLTNMSLDGNYGTFII